MYQQPPNNPPNQPSQPYTPPPSPIPPYPYPQQQLSLSPSVPQKWYRTNAGIIALLIFFFPIGVYLMWRYTSWPKNAKWIVTAILACCVLMGGIVNATSPTQQPMVGSTKAPIPKPTIAPTQASHPANKQAIKPTQNPTQLASLPESLTFHGDISGKLTMGTDSHPITHNNPTPDLVQKSDGTFFEPAPPWTQCSDFDTMAGRDYVAVIVGNVNGMRYAVTIEINENNSAYTKPGTELRPGNINSGGSVNVYEMSGKNRRWQQVYGPAQQDTVIVLYPDRIAGTVNAWMATTDQSQKTADSTLHMQGNWRCG